MFVDGGKGMEGSRHDDMRQWVTHPCNYTGSKRGESLGPALRSRAIAEKCCSGTPYAGSSWQQGSPNYRIPPFQCLAVAVCGDQGCRKNQGSAGVGQPVERPGSPSALPSMLYDTTSARWLWNTGMILVGDPEADGSTQYPAAKPKPKNRLSASWLDELGPTVASTTHE